jgi:atypical dual specificity phosphatase
MRRFYWLIENVLAGCSRPGAGSADVDADLAQLVERGICALLSLGETPLPTGALDRHGLHGLHLPVDDFQAPSTAQMLTALAFLDRAFTTHMPVAVHCLAGQGRTGTVLAAYLVRGGLPANTAIAEVRTICPGAIPCARQVEALRFWAAQRPWAAQDAARTSDGSPRARFLSQPTQGSRFPSRMRRHGRHHRRRTR